MTALSPEAAALLEAARHGHGPQEYDRERVLSSLHVSLGLAVSLAATASAATASAAAVSEPASLVSSGVQSSLQTAVTQAGQAAAVQGASTQGALGLGAKLLTWKAGKILLATVALGSAVGVTAVQRATRVESDAVRERSTQAVARGRAVEQPGGSAGQPAAPPRAQVPAAPHVPPAAAHAPGSASAPTASPPVAEPERVASPAPLASASPAGESTRVARSDVSASQAAAPRPSRHGTLRARHAARVASTRSAKERAHAAQRSASVAVAEPALAADDVAPAEAVPAAQPASEPELIRKALTSLRDRDSARALALLDEHAARYPDGAFATERRGLYVVALCAAGRLEEGKRAQTAFLAQAGQAPIAVRVRSACEPGR